MNATTLTAIVMLGSLSCTATGPFDDFPEARTIAIIDEDIIDVEVIDGELFYLTAAGGGTLWNLRPGLDAQAIIGNLGFAERLAVDRGSVFVAAAGGVRDAIHRFDATTRELDIVFSDQAIHHFDVGGGYLYASTDTGVFAVTPSGNVRRLTGPPPTNSTVSSMRANGNRVAYPAGSNVYQVGVDGTIDVFATKGAVQLAYAGRSLWWTEGSPTPETLGNTHNSQLSGSTIFWDLNGDKEEIFAISLEAIGDFIIALPGTGELQADVVAIEPAPIRHLAIGNRHIYYVTSDSVIKQLPKRGWRRPLF